MFLCVLRDSVVFFVVFVLVDVDFMFLLDFGVAVVFFGRANHHSIALK